MNIICKRNSNLSMALLKYQKILDLPIEQQDIILKKLERLGQPGGFGFDSIREQFKNK